MKSFIALFLFLISSVTLAQLTSRAPLTAKIAGPIPITYSAGNASSQALSNLSGYGHIMIFNACAGQIAVNVNFTSAPTTNDAGNVYVAATTGLILDNVPIGGTVWLRSDSGAPQTCTVLLTIW